MSFERYKANAYIFDKQDDGKELFVIEYPTKQKQGWYFWIVMESGTYELDLPKVKRLEIIGKVRDLNPSNLWEDTTDWLNVKSR